MKHAKRALAVFLTVLLTLGLFGAGITASANDDFFNDGTAQGSPSDIFTGLLMDILQWVVLGVMGVLVGWLWIFFW